MRERLFDVLEQTDGMNIPLQRDRGNQQNKRSNNRSKVAEFPIEIRTPPPRKKK
jgi:hypothetical protein